MSVYLIHLSNTDTLGKFAGFLFCSMRSRTASANLSILHCSLFLYVASCSYSSDHLRRTKAY